MSLEIVANALAKHLNTMPVYKPENDPVAVRWMYRFLLSAVITFFAGLMLFGRSGGDREPLAIFGLLLAFLGMFLLICGLFTPMMAKALAAKRQQTQKALTQPESDLYLPPDRMTAPIGSVTERTTELLEVETVKNAKPKRS